MSSNLYVLHLKGQSYDHLGKLDLESSDSIYENFTRQTSDIKRIGIFYFDNTKYYGGFLNKNIPIEMVFEVSHFKIRTHNSSKSIEFYIDTSSSFIQIANMFNNYYHDWKLPQGVEILGPEVNQEFESKVNSEIKEYVNSLSNFKTKLLDRQIDDNIFETFAIRNYVNNDIKKISQKLNWYQNFYSSSIINNASEKIRNILVKFDQDIDVENIEREIVEKRISIETGVFLEIFKKYGKLKLLNEKEKFKIDFNSPYDLYNQSQSRFINHGNRTGKYNNKQLKGMEKVYYEHRDTLSKKLTKFNAQIEQDIRDLKSQEEMRNIIENNEMIVLEILKKIKPGIQTQITRICELTKLEKKTAEKTIKELIQKNKNLGDYDDLSQVFIAGDNIGNEIDKLFEEFNYLNKLS